MSHLRVLVLPSWYPTESKPLFGSFVEEQVQAIAELRSDIELHVVAPSSHDEWVSPRRPLQAVRALVNHINGAPRNVEQSRSSFHVYQSPVAQVSPHLSSDVFVFQKLRLAQTIRAIRAEFGPIDLIHAHVFYPAGFVARTTGRKLGIPYLITEHQSPFPFPELLNASGELPSKSLAVFRDAAAVISVSNAHAADIRRYTGVQSHVIPNLTNETRFAPRSTPRANDLPFTFLSVGHLVEQKGFDVLLRAIAILRSGGVDARFRIVGDGKVRSELQTLARELRVDDVVTWRGAINRQELPREFQESDAFVLPSRHESFGVVLIEALASGLPLVATRCGGPEDIVTHANGELVDSDNPDDLARGLRSVMQSQRSTTAIREDFLGRFARRPIVDSIAHLYEQIVSARV